MERLFQTLCFNIFVDSKVVLKSTNEDDYNTDKVCDYLEDTSNNDSKSVYIDDSIDANMESGNYKFGTQSHVSYQYDHYVLFKEHPMKASGVFLKYTKYQIKEGLSRYNYFIFCMSQVSNPGGSSGDDFYYNTITM